MVNCRVFMQTSATWITFFEVKLKVHGSQARILFCQRNKKNFFAVSENTTLLWTERNRDFSGVSMRFWFETRNWNFAKKTSWERDSPEVEFGEVLLHRIKNGCPAAQRPLLRSPHWFVHLLAWMRRLALRTSFYTRGLHMDEKHLKSIWKLSLMHMIYDAIWCNAMLWQGVIVGGFSQIVMINSLGRSICFFFRWLSWTCKW